MARHRRPRYHRIVAVVAAVAITLLAVLGGTGVLPSDPAVAAAPQRDGSAAAPRPLTAGGSPEAQATTPSDALPADSGINKRVVFSIGRQRVWLVTDSDAVARSYPVSGSVTDNLSPGTYAVYSKSRRAVGIEDSGTMGYMVRFAHGENAAIGFHDIPVLDGRRVQTKQQLGTPQSHGCIRQWRPDAEALWNFTKVGTQVVVLS